MHGLVNTKANKNTEVIGIINAVTTHSIRIVSKDTILGDHENKATIVKHLNNLIDGVRLEDM